MLYKTKAGFTTSRKTIRKAYKKHNTLRKYVRSTYKSEFNKLICAYA